jgi:hypothetical protein
MTAIRDAFLKKVPKGASPSELAEMMAIAAQPGKDIDILTAVNVGTMETINLPGGVQPYSWTTINKIRFPSSFAKGNLETDAACMKHCKEETGDKPTKDKLASYFEELVSACEAAKDRWKQENKPSEYDANDIVEGVGRWHIILKNNDGDP